MALPARSVSKIAVLGLLLTACQASPDVARRSVRLGDPALQQRGPVLLFQHEPFTGVVLARYPNGDPQTMEPYQHGKRHGTALTWYPKRRKAGERPYEAGRRVGIHRGWWESGRLKFRHAYVGDEREGISEEWFADGTPYRRMHYAGGHEAGRQTIWQPDGRLLANYEVRKGRNYGLTGENSCAHAASRVSF